MRAAALTLGLLGACSSALAASPAWADTASDIRFIDTEPIVAEFGSSWVLRAVVSDTTAEGRPIDGSVDVFIDGFPGIFSSDVPVQTDGHVFISQPDMQPFLPAGTHTIRATFDSDAATGVADSQTATVSTLTIVPLELITRVSASFGDELGAVPVIATSQSGQYVDAFGGAAPGVWKIQIADESGEVVFERDAASAAGGDVEADFEVASELDLATTYVVTSQFIPDPSIAEGIDAAPIATVEFQTPEPTFGQTLESTLDIPIWALATVAGALVALVAGTILMMVVRIRFSRRLAGSPENATEQGKAVPTLPTLLSSELRVADRALRSIDEDLVSVPETVAEGHGSNAVPEASTPQRG